MNYGQESVSLNNVLLLVHLALSSIRPICNALCKFSGLLLKGRRASDFHLKIKCF